VKLILYEPEVRATARPNRRARFRLVIRLSTIEVFFSRLFRPFVRLHRQGTQRAVRVAPPGWSAAP